MKKKISIVTPTYNEEENIEKLCSSIAIEMALYDYEYEHIIIDNHSTDKTVEKIKKIAFSDKKVKLIVNSRNFGSIRSTHHAILQTDSDATILMCADMQEPINLIGKYLKEWEMGSKVVLGQRESVEEGKILNLVKNFFYKFINKISEIPLIERSGSTCLLSKDIVDHLKKIDDPYPYFRGLLSEITSEIKIVKYHQNKREGGVTKSNFFVLYDHAILGIIKHSKIPVRIFTILGFFASFISLLIAIIFFLYKLAFWNSFEVGVAPLIIGLFGLASIQMFLLGFVGEYLIQILTHSRKLPLVIEKERINFN